MPYNLVMSEFEKEEVEWDNSQDFLPFIEFYIKSWLYKKMFMTLTDLQHLKMRKSQTSTVIMHRYIYIA